MKPFYPNYEKCLVNLSSSILKEFGIECKYGTLRRIDKLFREESYKNIIVLMYAGMGTRILDKHLTKDSFLLSNRMMDIFSVYPCNDIAATTSFLSAETPYEHGCFSKNACYSIIDESDEIIGDDVLKEDFKYESIFDKINVSDVGKAYGIFPFGVGGYKNREEAYNRIINLSKNSGKKLIYAYFEEPNCLMSELGINNDMVHAEILKIDEQVRKLCGELQDSIIFITADHGNIESDPIILSEYSEIYNLVESTISIETRCMGVRVKKNCSEEFKELFMKKFGKYFLLMDYAEVIKNKLFGYGSEHKCFKDCMCDFFVVSFGKHYLCCDGKELKSKSFYGGLAESEMLLPLVTILKKPFKDGIRRVVSSDYKEVRGMLAGIQRFMVQNRRDIFNIGAGISTGDFERYCVKNSPSTCFVYTISDVIVGFIRVKYNMLDGYSKFTSFSYIEIENVYVKEDYRGRGIGTELVNYVLASAKKLRVKRVEFCAWNFDDKTSKFIEKFSSRELAKILEVDLY